MARSSQSRSMLKAAGRLARRQPLRHRGRRRKLRLDQGDGQFAERQLELLHHVVGAGTGRGIDQQPAIHRIDPDVGQATLDEGPRQQFGLDLVGDSRACLRPGL
jgi:hypothetical protein